MRTDGSTDRYDQANGGVSQFCERAIKPQAIKKYSWHLNPSRKGYCIDVCYNSDSLLKTVLPLV
jgi:hypothetical protein